MTSFVLKLIGIVAMLIDHSAYVLVEPTKNLNLYIFMRGMGRIAFPIFCYLAVEGYQKTSNLTKYLRRMFIFAIISEVPFDIVFNGEYIETGHQNVFFTLFLGLIAIFCYENIDCKKISEKVRTQILFKVCIAMFVGAVANSIGSDYGAMGVWLILFLYVCKENKLAQFTITTVVLFTRTAFDFIEKMYEFNGYNNLMNSYKTFYGCSSFAVIALLWIEMIGILGIPIANFYDGRKGIKLKYVFYAFYPIHMVILYIVSVKIM